MRPSEKAKELTDKYMNADYTDIGIHGAKQCALICVDEILNDNPNIYDSDRLNHNYWKNVKKEISLL